MVHWNLTARMEQPQVPGVKAGLPETKIVR